MESDGTVITVQSTAMVEVPRYARTRMFAHAVLSLLRGKRETIQLVVQAPTVQVDVQVDAFYFSSLLDATPRVMLLAFSYSTTCISPKPPFHPGPPSRPVIPNACRHCFDKECRRLRKQLHSLPSVAMKTGTKTNKFGGSRLICL